MRCSRRNSRPVKVIYDCKTRKAYLPWDKSQPWGVYKNGKRIDTVFYDKNLDADYVKRGLIEHDGYDPDITVRKRKL